MITDRDHAECTATNSLHTHSIGPPHSSLLTLRTLSAPLNPADINQIQGTYPTAPPFTSTLGTTLPTAVPGNEACFEVLAAGSGVKNVKKGDWVMAKQTGLGTWRTHLQIEEGKITRVEREGLRSEQVGTVGVCAHYSELLVISCKSFRSSNSSLHSLSAISRENYY